ncbi:MAG: hypothetical protein Q8L47_05470 [bacterium]|nr:hypothetical protein [bacterium]
MNISYSPQFLRSFTKLSLEVQNIYRTKEILFKSNPYHALLKTHKLKGANVWSFSVTYKIRVLFVINQSGSLFVNIGDHSIYRKDF